MKTFFPALAFTCSLLVISCKQETKKQTHTNLTTITSDIKSDAKLSLIWQTDTIFKTTESCLYDAKRKVIYVSNVNNAPRTKDHNGFISKLDKDGKLIALTWAKEMSAPKGMGLFNDTLYATDIDAVVAIDINTGAIKDRYTLEGALMLNDITIDAKGVVYVTDMDTGKIYTLKDGVFTLWMENLNKPNGLLVDGTTLVVAFNGDHNLKSFDITTKKEVKLLASNTGNSDGVVKTNAGNYVVSDWKGEIFYVTNGTATSLYNTVADRKAQTADIGIIPNDNIILVPTFFGNGVKAFKLTE